MIAPPETAPAPKTKHAALLTNPRLSANLRSECEALLNDVRQTRELAEDLQRQLDGKSTEAEQFKELFERTQLDLGNLQSSITELRQERHRLANEAMRAMAYERRLEDVTLERNELSGELEIARRELSSSVGEVRERDLEVARLNSQVAELQTRLGAVPSFAAAAHEYRNEQVSTTLAEMWGTLSRLQTVLDPRNAQDDYCFIPERPAASEEFIDDAFDLPA